MHSDEACVLIDGESLTSEKVLSVAREDVPVTVDPSAMLRVRRCRAVIERLLEDESRPVVYGLNTGFGSLRNIVIEPDQVEQLQHNLIRSHSCGVGPPTPLDIVRAMMLLRANTLVKGHSGVRPVVVETLVEMLNRRVHPVVPVKGSVGASGDLAPLSHSALVMIGEGKVLFEDWMDAAELKPGQDGFVSGAEAMEAAGIETIKLKAKEGLALNNGTQFMTAWGVLASADAQYVASVACQACALSVEAIKGVSRAFVKEIHAVRPHDGQVKAAEIIHDQLQGSDILRVPINTARLHNARAMLSEAASNLEKHGSKQPAQRETEKTESESFENLIANIRDLRDLINTTSHSSSEKIRHKLDALGSGDEADWATEADRRDADKDFDPLIDDLRTIYAKFCQLEQKGKLPGTQASLMENAAKLIDLAMHELERAVPDFLPVQDDYSFRCAPQVIGAAVDTLNYVGGILQVEMNSATDNPLIFPPDPKTGEEDPDVYRRNLDLNACKRAIVSGGNFHGEPIALALDQACIAVAEIGNIAERRIFQLTSDHLNNGLPAFLTKRVGLHSGLMIAQYTAAALVSENKTLSHPASVDSIPTCADAEDHVSMGAFAARKFADVVNNATLVVATELLCAAQGVELREPAMPSPANKELFATIRSISATVDDDRPLSDDIEKIANAIRNRNLI